jgi:quinolinate synthase
MSTTIGTQPAHPRHPLDLYPLLSDSELEDRITAAKRRLGDKVVILGHHYQRDEVVRHADFLGDSYKLSKQASETVADFIVFCGVHFMAESADVLGKANQRVILPDLGAGCSMSDMADIDQVEEAWAELQEMFGDTFIPITYMNSSAAIKAFCGRHGGLVCTSSNASEAFRWARERKPRILFLPDEHLGRNTGAALGIGLDEMSLWQPLIAVDEARAFIKKDTPLVLWKGYCSVHQRFTESQVSRVKSEFPGIKVIVHPECPYEVCQAADSVGSTEHILKAVTDAPAGSKWAVGTEIHMVHRLAENNPDKLVISLQQNVCACSTMYRIDPVHLCWVLENLADGVVVNEIKVESDTSHWARVALERMLELHAEPRD